MTRKCYQFQKILELIKVFSAVYTDFVDINRAICGTLTGHAVDNVLCSADHLLFNYPLVYTHKRIRNNNWSNARGLI